MALTNENGVVTDTYTYDAWGNVTNHIDPNPGDGIGLTTDNPYQYVGESGYYTHYEEPSLNLLQVGVRYYDPTIGLFTQHGSPYAYAENNPTKNTQSKGNKDKKNNSKYKNSEFTRDDYDEVTQHAEQYKKIKEVLKMEKGIGTKCTA
ncbi:MAG: hypothetical protein ABFD46_11640 [Armatimonadota bacterium]